ncbi:hypothetical protein QF028_001510 [Neobacillus sp. B4I6]
MIFLYVYISINLLYYNMEQVEKYVEITRNYEGGYLVTRSADYTIQGFIYQFNKTLLAILEDKEESEISIEGVI